MRGLVHLQPLACRHLVRAEHGPDLVVEDLGCRSRERCETGCPESFEVVAERQAEGRRALPDLERGERVHVQVRQDLLDRAADVHVEVAREGRMDAALQADLGAAALPGLLATADNLVERDEVRGAAQVGRQLPLGKGAEAAAEVADICVVDVPCDDVGDGVAADLAAQEVGGLHDSGEVVTAGSEELCNVVFGELDLVAHLCERLGDPR